MLLWHSDGVSMRRVHGSGSSIVQLMVSTEFQKIALKQSYANRGICAELTPNADDIAKIQKPLTA